MMYIVTLMYVLNCRVCLEVSMLCSECTQISKNLCSMLHKNRYSMDLKNATCHTAIDNVITFIVIFKNVTTCFNFKDMFRCCRHHLQLHNV